jgi:hypothetical protein
VPGKVKVPNLRKEKQSIYLIAKLHNKNESSTHEICKKAATHAGFAVERQTAKVIATVCDMHLVKVEKALLYVVKYDLWFQRSTGDLGMHLPWIRRDYYTEEFSRGCKIYDDVVPFFKGMCAYTFLCFGIPWL